MQKAILILFSALLLITACKNEEKQLSSTKHQESEIEGGVPKLNITLAPDKGKYFKTSENIKIEVVVRQKKDVALDSVVYNINGKQKFVLSKPPYRKSLAADLLQLGLHSLTATVYYNETHKDSRNTHFFVLPSTHPKEFDYQVVKSFPHDKNAYTQGLYYENGYFYESTGRYGKSSLRKVDKKTGKVLQSYQLAPKYFGEGLAVYNGKIIQLTYKAQKAFIYDKSTFNLIQTIDYGNLEGWGITHNGKHFIFTDGTNKLFYYDEKTFSLLKEVSVYNHQGPVSRLNELEYINGTVYANVYGTDKIVAIDPASGQVTGILNLTGLLDKSDYHTNIDVLNGIAYDNQSGHLYVTGKNWPKLFEIKVSSGD
jgi:glutamine cyclotransferase